MSGRHLTLLALSLLGAPWAEARAQAPAARSLHPSEPPGSELSIAIMTMGVGAEVWERFGHNAIVVTDRRAGTSMAYNYGMFSFRQENFLLRFLQGRMWYWMAAFPTEDDVPRYMAAGRSVWLQELNLSPAQRARLRDDLETNARPENRFYRYDYYRDNCSTRVRDAIDRVLNGAIRAQMSGPASGSYRFHTLRLNTNNLPLYTGLDLVLGQGADVPVTRWQEMFLPLKLRDYLREVRVPDSSGALVPLVSSERALYESSKYPVPDAPPGWAAGYLVLGIALGGLFWWGGVAGRRSGGARRVLLFGGTAWALITGLAGTILVGLWGLTDHLIASRNENALQVTIFALGLAVVLPFAGAERPAATRVARALAVLVGALSLLGLLLKVLPAFDQVNGQMLALFVPANLGLMLGSLAWAREGG